MKKKLIPVLMFVISGAALAQQEGNQLPGLDISFASADWDGETIPEGQQCARFGGTPSTPPLQVNGIPRGTNVLVLAFADADNPRMDRDGHGVIGFRIAEDQSSVVIPPVAGHSYDLPKGFFMVSEHKAAGWDKEGAYLAPCSGGKGNRYYVTVTAYHEKSTGGSPALLAGGRLTLGWY